MVKGGGGGVGGMKYSQFVCVRGKLKYEPHDPLHHGMNAVSKESLYN